jgi:hypothetical protein
MRIILEQHPFESKPTTDSLQHISEILPGVLATILQAANSQHETSKPDARMGSWQRCAA